MESPFKTPSKPPLSQVFPTSGSSSPFTPKRSLIKKKSEEQLNSVPSVSRKLAFDDSCSQSPFNSKLQFSPLSQQALSSLDKEFDESEEITPVKTFQKYKESNNRFLSSPNFKNLPKQLNTTKEILSPKQQPLSCKNEILKSEPTTPIKTPQKYCDITSKILLSPSIKNRPKRFNLIENEKNISIPSPKKRDRSANSTPSKRFKSNVINNSKLITHYFKPTQKRPDSINKDSSNLSPKCISNEENMNLKSKLCIQSTSDNILDSKVSAILKVPQQILSKNMSLSLKNKQKRSPGKNIAGNKNSITKIESPNKTSVILSHKSETNKIQKKETTIKKENESNEVRHVTPNKNENFKNYTPMKSPKIIEYLENKIPISGGDTYSKQVTPNKNENLKNNTPMKSPRIIEYLENKVSISGGDTYSRFIKYIVLKGELFIFGKGEIINTVENCSDDELKIFGRLISRKHGWIRYNEPDGLKKYKEKNLCVNFDSVLESLATKQLINTDVISCELDCLLNILKSQELKELQKTFNINLSSNKKTTKSQMIKAFINLVKNQRTFCGNSVTNLKERVKKKLGYCLKVSDKSRNDLLSCLIYETYPYFKGDEKDRFRDCFNTFSLFEKKQIKFPNFETKRVSVNFYSEESLESYKIALSLRSEVQLSLEQKDIENAIMVLKIVFQNFQSIINDKLKIEEFQKIPTYMRKYSALSVYAHTLFKNITILKKSTTDKDLAKEVLEFLLKHKEFSNSKQTAIHIELAKVFESQYKQLDLAAKVILNGLKESDLSELDRQMLSNRAMMYVNRKVRKLDNELKEELLSVITISKTQIPTTTINGKIISNHEMGISGRKQVYSKKTENGDILCMSVEELALSHYKSQGFLNGIHDEGSLIKSMFLLCFWDIIYGSYHPHHIFINQFQDCPLDWRTRHFYEIRKQNIKDRMAELKQMNVDEICDMLKMACEEHFDTQSVINWKFINVDNIPMCRTLLECVGIDVFLAIGEQILKDGRVYLHGMPDLIIWDAVSQKSMFVEVKGPKDKLSERQHSWLIKLMELGANVEVCNVVGTGGKNTEEIID